MLNKVPLLWRKIRLGLSRLSHAKLLLKFSLVIKHSSHNPSALRPFKDKDEQ